MLMKFIFLLKQSSLKKVNVIYSIISIKTKLNDLIKSKSNTENTKTSKRIILHLKINQKKSAQRCFLFYSLPIN